MDNAGDHANSGFFGADLTHIAILARIIERAALTFIVISSVILLMMLLRKKIQDVDLNIESKSGILKTSLSFSMPIFLLLVLVLFAFIAFSNPVKFDFQYSSVPSLPNIHSAESAPSTGTKLQKEAHNGSIMMVGYLADANDARTLILAINSYQKASEDLNVLLEAGETNIDKYKPHIGELYNVSRQIDIIRYKILEKMFGIDTINMCKGGKKLDMNASSAKKCKDLFDISAEVLK